MTAAAGVRVEAAFATFISSPQMSVWATSERLGNAKASRQRQERLGNNDNPSDAKVVQFLTVFTLHFAPCNCLQTTT